MIRRPQARIGQDRKKTTQALDQASALRAHALACRRIPHHEQDQHRGQRRAGRLRRMSPSSRGLPGRRRAARCRAARRAGSRSRWRSPRRWRNARGAQRMARSMITVIAPPKPMPIRKRPIARPAPPSAMPKTRVPASATRASAAAVRRIPKRSKARPIGTWATAEASIMERSRPRSRAARPEAAVQLARDPPPPARWIWAMTRRAPAMVSTRIMAAEGTRRPRPRRWLGPRRMR